MFYVQSGFFDEELGYFEIHGLIVDQQDMAAMVPLPKQ